MEDIKDDSNKLSIYEIKSRIESLKNKFNDD